MVIFLSIQLLLVRKTVVLSVKDTIYLKRKNKVIVEHGDSKLDSKYMLALIKNIESLRYSISTALAECLSTFNEKQILVFYRELVSDLRRMVGANVKFRPMCPNFPKQVEKTPKEVLFSINFLHYLGGWITLPHLKVDFPSCLK